MIRWIPEKRLILPRTSILGCLNAGGEAVVQSGEDP